MINYLRKERWSPFVVGLLIAVLSNITFFLFEKTLGTSVAITKVTAFFLSFVDKNYVFNNSYFQEYLKDKIWFNWQVFLVIGVFLGAFISKMITKKSASKTKETSSCNLKGNNSLKSLITAFIGGIFIIFGARLAGGCTSGHAISGGFQLALSGWLFMIGVFAVGIPSAFIIYRKKI